MTKKQLLFWFIQIVLATLLGSLRYVERNSGGQSQILRTLSAFTDDHRLLIASSLLLLIGILAGWTQLISPRKKAKEIRQKIMGAMLEELFNRDKNNFRISIFRRATLFRRLRIYGKQMVDCLKCWWRGEKSRFFWGQYVYVSERLGTEHPNSKTFFYYSPDTVQKCQGVAGAAMQGLTDIIVPDLPDIDGIDLSTIDLKNKKLGGTKRVLEYMNRGYVSDIQTLRRINKAARHIYGNILNNIDGNPKGVLVIDSFLPDSFLTEDVRARLGVYATIMGTTM